MVIDKLLQSPWFALLTFLLGFVISHFTAIWRDRRKEFNAAAAPIRAYLLAQMEQPTLVSGKPTDVEMDLFRQHLSGRQYDQFTRAWASLSVTRADQYEGQENGEDRFRDLAPVLKATVECLRFTGMR